ILSAIVQPLPGKSISVWHLTNGTPGCSSLNMLLGARGEGKVAEDTDTIVEYPSGGTVTLLDILARIMGIEVAYLSNKSSPAELDILRLFRESVQPFFGPHVLLGRVFPVPGTGH
ncbi:hypothetical protein FRC10_003001, partial [Ceratobasidium sp. 414]